MAGEPTRFERGAARLRKVYAGDVVDLPEGTMAFNDVMVRTLFAEVWAQTSSISGRAGSCSWA